MSHFLTASFCGVEEQDLSALRRLGFRARPLPQRLRARPDGRCSNRLARPAGSLAQTHCQRSKRGQRVVGRCSRRVQSDGRCVVGQNATVQPRQHLARSNLHEHRHPLGRQPTNQVDVKDRRGELGHQVPSDFERLVLRLVRDAGPERSLRSLQSHRRQRLSERLFRRLQHRRVVGTRHGEQPRRHSTLLQPLLELLDRLGRAADDRLVGCVVVGHPHRRAAFVNPPLDRLAPLAHRQQSAGVGHEPLNRLGPGLRGPNGFADRPRAGRDQCSELAVAVPHDDVRTQARVERDGVKNEVGSQHGQLRPKRVGAQTGVCLPGHLGERRQSELAQHFVHLPALFGCGRARLDQLAKHARVLRPLTRKHQRHFGRTAAVRQNQNALLVQRLPVASVGQRLPGRGQLLSHLLQVLGHDGQTENFLAAFGARGCVGWSRVPLPARARRVHGRTGRLGCSDTDRRAHRQTGRPLHRLRPLVALGLPFRRPSQFGRSFQEDVVG